MYSRELKEPPKHIINKGKATFGTFAGVPKEIDIRGLRSPYGNIPLPPFISNIRIKSTLSYFFNLEKYIGYTGFADFKVFGFATVCLWNKDTGKKYSYHVLMPVRRRFVPKKTAKGSCTSFLKSRHIRISWGHEYHNHSTSFRLKGDSARPAAEGFIYSLANDEIHNDLLFVNPSPVKSRCKATWLCSLQLHGKIKIGEDAVSESDGLGAMLLTRSYIKARNYTTTICALGNVADKKLILEITSSSLDAADSDKYNDNALILNGEATTLPPVYMTHSFGKHKQWIIQDTESMVDLTFNPISINNRNISMLPIRSSYKMIYGTLNGVVLTKDGEKINLKNFPAIIYDNLLRM